MWRRRNIRRGVLTAILILMVAPSSVRAGESLSTEGVVSGFQAVRRWTDAFDAPKLDSPAARVEIDGATGVCVMLRQRGRVVGTGVDLTGDDGMVRRAGGRALADVLGDPAVTRLPDARRTEIGPRLTVEIEVAGPLVPLPGRTYEQLAAQVSPGLDGLALRLGDDIAAIFPSQLRLADTADAVATQLPALAVELGLPAKKWTELRRTHPVQAYRFRTMHLAQRAPGHPPLETVRGQQIVWPSEVTDDALRTLASSMVDHAITGLWPGEEPLGLMGDYLPVADRYRPLIAAPRDQGLMAFALARYAAVPGLPPSERDRALATASVILVNLAVVGPGETDPRSEAAAAAAITLAFAALPAEAMDDDLAEFRAASRETTSTVDLATLAPHTRAMVVAARAALLTGADDAGPPPDTDETGAMRAAIDATWSAVPPPAQPSLLPWIVLAEEHLAIAAGTPSERVEAMQQLRDVLDQTRHVPTGEGPPDLHGGFGLTGSGPARATAQTVRPAAALAAMLRDPVLTPPEIAVDEAARLRATLRFIMQLTVRDPMLWAIPAPERALGGIRAAPWSLQQPTAAQAMGLLAVAEALISFNAVAPGERGGPSVDP